MIHDSKIDYYIVWICADYKKRIALDDFHSSSGQHIFCCDDCICRFDLWRARARSFIRCTSIVWWIDDRSRFIETHQCAPVIRTLSFTVVWLSHQMINIFLIHVLSTVLMYLALDTYHLILNSGGLICIKMVGKRHSSTLFISHTEKKEKLFRQNDSSFKGARCW